MDAVTHFFQGIPVDLLIIQTVNGVVTGMILALVASGLTLIFGILDVVNFAHGVIFMLGAEINAALMKYRVYSVVVHARRRRNNRDSRIKDASEPDPSANVGG